MAATLVACSTSDKDAGSRRERLMKQIRRRLPGMTSRKDPSQGGRNNSSAGGDLLTGTIVPQERHRSARRLTRKPAR